MDTNDGASRDSLVWSFDLEAESFAKHLSELSAFPYHLLWGERTIRSVANLTRRDGEEFLALAPDVPVRTEVETFALKDANEALNRLRMGQVRGAAVLVTQDAAV